MKTQEESQWIVAQRLLSALTIPGFNEVVYKRFIFSKARNYSFSLATQKWLMWVDADDIVFGAEKLNSIIVADSNKSIVLRDGERYILEELIHEKTNQDKILLINCWASWCMPCIAELKELIPELQKEINSDIEIIYLSIDTDLQSWNNAENKLGLNNSKDSYIVANKDIPYLISHQVEQVPTNFIYDKKGKLIKKIVGSVTIENIRAIINNVD